MPEISIPEFATSAGVLRPTEEVIFDAVSEARRIAATGLVLCAAALETFTADMLNEYGVGRGDIESGFTEAHAQITEIDETLERIIA